MKTKSFNLVVLTAGALLVSACSKGTGPQDGRDKLAIRGTTRPLSAALDTEPSAGDVTKSEGSARGQRVASPPATLPKTEIPTPSKKEDDKKVEPSAQTSNLASATPGVVTEKSETPPVVVTEQPKPLTPEEEAELRKNSILVKMVYTPSPTPVANSSAGSASAPLSVTVEESRPGTLPVFMIRADQFARIFDGSPEAKAMFTSLLGLADMRGGEGWSVIENQDYASTAYAGKTLGKKISRELSTQVLYSSSCYLLHRRICVVIEKVTIQGSSLFRLFSVTKADLVRTMETVTLQREIPTLPEGVNLPALFSDFVDGIYVLTPVDGISMLLPAVPEKEKSKKEKR